VSGYFKTKKVVGLRIKIYFVGVVRHGYGMNSTLSVSTKAFVNDIVAREGKHQLNYETSRNTAFLLPTANKYLEYPVVGSRHLSYEMNLLPGE
jgi:hypothetical protein